MKKNDLTASQVAVRFDVDARTVRLWCTRGLFPRSRSEETPRGPVWIIPESDLVGFVPPKPGPKPKASGTDGSVTVKKGGKR